MRLPPSNYFIAARLRMFLLWGVAVFPAMSATAQQMKTVVGQIRSLAGATVTSGVTLRLETSDGTLITQQMGATDGRFTFDNLSKMVYRLVVTAPEFQPFSTNIDLTGIPLNVLVDVNLVPLDKTRAPANLPLLTDEAAPKKARKEYEKGSRALAEQKLSEAQLHLEKAVEEYPCYARAQTDLALARIRQNDAADAEASLRKSIACDGGYLEAYAMLGKLLNGSKRYADCEKILVEGLRRSPSAWEIYYPLADAHSGLEQYSKAEEEYLKVRSLNPAAPAELHVKLADLYHRMHAYDKSFAEMQAYLRDDPKGRYAARTRVVMQEMESSGVVHVARTHPAEEQP